jgi:uncharacterized membrane protein
MAHRNSSETLTNNQSMNSPWIGSSSLSSKTRNAMLIAGGSALGYGLWKRGALGWPFVVAGSLLVSRAATQSVPKELSVDVSFTINRSPEEVYGFWSDANNWPLFMKGVQSAEQRDENTIVWKTSGTSMEGRSQISDRQPSQYIRWTDFFMGMTIDCSIEFRPAPGNRGTEVRWHLHSSSPRTMLAHLVGTAAGLSADQLARESLRRMKQLLEAGEIPTTDGQPHGDRGLTGKTQRVLLRESADEDRKRPAREVPQPTQQIVAS